MDPDPNSPLRHGRPPVPINIAGRPAPTHKP